MASQPQAGFQPPAYIASLIASINDGARAAQTGGLFMLAIAVYLMATVISTTDEVLLRGTFVTFQQIGLQVPVVASYALAPLVFLFLYVHTLIRYDMLAENLRLLDRELRTALPLEADRDRCRQLLANVEFVQYWIAPKGSPWHSPVYPVLVWVMLVAIPIVVFLATQISFLRYQSAFVTYIHLGSLAAALTAITYFWYRHARRRQDWQPFGLWGKVRTLTSTAWPAVVALLLAGVYLRIPPPDSTTAGKPAAEAYWKAAAEEWRRAALRGEIATLASRVYFAIPPPERTADLLIAALQSPLDIVVCPLLNWGCRFLRLDHRLLIQDKPEGEVLFKLRTGESELEKLLLRVDALFLRNRSFRFADFSDSEFYDSDLVEVDLRGALLTHTQLQGASLMGAQMRFTNLVGAQMQAVQMQGADLVGAQMAGADLSFAQTQGADLRSVKMQDAIARSTQMQGALMRGARMQRANMADANIEGADLGGAELQGVDLARAWMPGVNLREARIQGADLAGAAMQRATLRGANIDGTSLQGANMQAAELSFASLKGVNLQQAAMQGADLREARLQGANLRGAGLQRADLRQAQMQGADLREVSLWEAQLHDSNLSLADMRAVDLQPIDDDQLAQILHSLEGFLVAERDLAGLSFDPCPRTNVGPTLTDAESPDFANFGVSPTRDVTVYDALLSPFLADLAAKDANVARGIAQRALLSQRPSDNPDAKRRMWPDLARRLLAAEKGGAFSLDLAPQDRKMLEELAAKTN